MKHLITIFTLSILHLSFSQGPTFEWAKGFGGTNSVLVSSLAVDFSGNVYTVGSFNGTVDFDPGVGVTNLISAGGFDIFVQKMDASGNFLWARSFGGTSYDRGLYVCADDVGNVYITGLFTGTADFDPAVGVTNITSNGAADIFVQKMDGSGNFLWARGFGGIGEDNGACVNIDASGNIYTTGIFSGTTDFDPSTGVSNLISNGSYDVFLQKMDGSGNFLWARSFGSTTNDYGTAIAIDSADNVYTTGRFTGTTDFDPSPNTLNLTPTGNTDVYVHKLTASGNFLWVKTFGGTTYDYARSINIDASGNIYTTGIFSGTADFDPSIGTVNHTSAGAYDVFIHKLDSLGDFLWVKTFGTTSHEETYSASIDASSNIYITGSFGNTVDFDPGIGNTSLTSAGSNDVYVHKLDSLGNFVWAQSFGGTGNDQGFTIKVDVSGNIYTAGSFEGTADFDPGVGTSNITSLGGEDSFIHKMSQCQPNTGVDVQTACDIYTWIDGNNYTSNNNSATWTLTNAAGCDSVVTLDLTITNSNTGTDIQSACDSYTWIDGNTYTSSNNTATWTLTNQAGCDSVVTLDLTINNVSDINTSVNGLTITADNANASYVWLDCDDNYSILPGETGQIYTATTNGNYAVQLTENGCVDTSACVAITTVGILENTFSNTFILYPNPTNGVFSIQFGSPQTKVEMKVMDLSGKVIENRNFANVVLIEHDLDEPKGIYLIEVSNAKGERSMIRLIKQ